MTRQFQFKGKLIRVLTTTRRLPNGRKAQLDIVKHPGAVLIVPFLDRDRLILIHQFRPVLNTYLYELPAGTLNPGERPLACAGRELMEETGYRAGKLTKIGKIFPVPGYSTEVITIFKAEKLKRFELSFKNLSFPNALVPTLVSLGRNPDRIVGIGNPHKTMTGPPTKTFGGDNFGQKDPDEIIQVRPMTRLQIKNLFRRGRINDAKTISALAFCGILY